MSMDHLIDEGLKEKVNNLADFGCGQGEYAKHMNENGVNASCYDGNANTPNVTDGRCQVLDLAEPFVFPQPFEWVMSLEVAEHVPAKFEDIFVGNLHHNNAHGIVLSWALEGQAVRAHVNNHNNDYVKDKMKKLGYENDVDAEKELRASVTNCWWFKNTIMVYILICQSMRVCSCRLSVFCNYIVYNKLLQIGNWKQCRSVKTTLKDPFKIIFIHLSTAKWQN